MMAATLDEVSGGRFNLGLSAGSGEFLEWIGVRQEQPYTAVVETVQTIKQLLTGERAAINGKFLQWQDKAYLRFKPLRRVPIYIGAMSPKMLRGIGEFADGGLPLLFPPEHYRNIRPYIDEGLSKTGRKATEVDVAACIWCSVSGNRQAAKDVLREKSAYYGYAMSPMILEQLGLTVDDFTEIEQAVMRENDLKKAAQMVTEQMTQIGIAGNAQDLIPRVEKLVEIGAKHISFGPPLGPDLEEAIETLGNEVIPDFRG